MKQRINKGLLSFSIITIVILLILNPLITSRNNKIIEHNRTLQKEAEAIEIETSRIAIEIIHNLDLGVRSYALYGKEEYLYPLNVAVEYKDSILNDVERSLLQQHYTLDEFYQLKDSINDYMSVCLHLLELVRTNNMDEFYRISDLNKGYHLWLQYERFSRKVSQFEREINEHARQTYDAATRNNYLIQIFLGLFCVPTLLFTALHTVRKFAVEMRLRKSEAEKATLLATQNEKLEENVKQRTRELSKANKELQERNEEVMRQNEEIAAQNDELNTQREELVSRNMLLMESKKLQLDIYKRNLMEKSRIISEISQELKTVKGEASPIQEQIQKFNNILYFNILTDDDWERFKKAFQEVYPNFFASLRYRFPSITAAELRLSAIIKMNLSLKETAGMLGISVDGVKKSRYRLKKKLALEDDVSLERYIHMLG